MRWRGRRQSANIEDRRGRSVGRTVGIGGGVGGVVLILVIYLLGGDPSALLVGQGAPPAQQGPYVEGDAEAALRELVAVVLAETEAAWPSLLEGEYLEPDLVLYTEAVQSACGTAPSSVGPFYCPADQQIYIDLSFFRDLAQRFGAPGDFAIAYVVAHEVGHHVQTLLGITEGTQRARQGLSEAEANALSVRQELQADCFAGLWAHFADRSRDLLEADDVEEALTAAAAIGDDRLQRQAGAPVDPDSFTHGTSAERAEWFERGWRSGRLEACDTF